MSRICSFVVLTLMLSVGLFLLASAARAQAPAAPAPVPTPQTSNDLIVQAQALEKQFQWEAASKLYAQATDIDLPLHPLQAAADLDNEANDEEKLSRHDVSIALYKRALTLQTDGKDLSGQAHTYLGMAIIAATVDEAASKDSDALDILMQALLISKSVKADGGQADVLRLLGSAYLHLHEYAKAASSYAEALPLYQTIGDKDGQAKVFNNLGVVYDDLNQRSKAIEEYTQAVPLLRDAGSKDGEAQVLSHIGYTYSEMKQPMKALGYYAQALPLYQASGDKAGQALLLTNAGRAEAALSRYAKALDDYTQVLDLDKETQDEGGEARALNDIGQSYCSLGEAVKALDDYLQALPLLRETGDKDGEAATLNNLGSAYDALSRHAEALDDYTQALPLYEAVEDKEGEATTLNNLGSACNDLSKPAKALEYLSQALSLYKDAGNASGEATVLTNIGGAYDALSQSTNALGDYTQALHLFKDVGDKDGEAAVLSRIGEADVHLSQYAKALACYAQALPLVKAAGDKNAEASVDNNIGEADVHLGESAKAIDYFARSRSLHEATGNKDGEATALNNLGEAYDALSEYSKGLIYFKQALSLTAAAGDKTGEATVLSNIGSAYLRLGQPAEAIKDFAQALPLSQDAGDRTGEATELENLGGVYAGLNQPSKAITYYSQTLPLLRDAGNRDGEAATLNNLGSAAASLHEPVKALEYYVQALPLYHDAGDKTGEATVLNNTGSAYDDLHDSAKAVGYFTRALRLLQDTGDQDGEAAALNNLGEASADLHQSAKAVGYFARALPLYRRIADKDGQAVTFGDLMEISAEVLHHSRLGILYGKQAINLYQYLRSELTSLDKGAQQSYLKDKEPTYRYLADLLIKEHRLSEAQQVLHLLKEREFYDFLNQAPNTAPALLDRLPLTKREAKWITRYDHMSQPLERIGEEQQALHTGKALTPEQQTQKTALDKKFAVAEAVVKRVQDQTVQDFSSPATSDDTPPGVAQADELARSLPNGTVVLYTIVGTDTIQLILGTNKKTTAYKSVITSDKLYAMVLDLRGALTEPAKDPRPLAAQLYDLVLGPVQRDLDKAQTKTILFSLDDALRYIPPAVLYNPATKRYLAQDYQSELITLAVAPNARPAQTAPVVLGMGVSLSQDGAPALPGVTQELDALIRQPGNPNGLFPGTRLLDAAFTQSAMTTALGKHGYPLVHIASHFALHATDDASYLLMGDGTRMSVTDLRLDPHRFAGVDLLTLSACDTAMEVKASNGREVEGIGVLAQTLGARDVIASLWPVSDAVTPQLMAALYRWRRDHPGSPLTETLRQAQMTLLTGTDPGSVSGTISRSIIADSPAEHSDAPPFTPDPKAPYAHPYYWAPFILIGNWK